MINRTIHYWNKVFFLSLIWADHTFYIKKLYFYSKPILNIGLCVRIMLVNCVNNGLLPSQSSFSASWVTPVFARFPHVLALRISQQLPHDANYVTSTYNLSWLILQSAKIAWQLMVGPNKWEKKTLFQTFSYG